MDAKTLDTPKDKPAKRRSKLTKTVVEALQPEAVHYVHWDTMLPGFGVRVMHSGTRAFVFNYIAGKKERRQTLGRFPVLTVDKARKAAQALAVAVAGGADPLEEKQKKRREGPEPTVADLVARAMSEHYAKRSASMRRNVETLAKLYLLPALGRRTVASVTHHDIGEIFRKIGQGHGETPAAPFQANRFLSLCSKLWTLAARWGLSPAASFNPASRRLHDAFAEPRRGQGLSKSQLAGVGSVIAADHDRATASAFLFTLLCGCRPGEAMAAKWADIDPETRTWTLPASKTGPRSVTLGAAALALLAEQPRRGVWVFMRPDAAAPVKSFRYLWNRCLEAAQLPEGVRVYDAVRHTWASTAAELDVPEDTRKLIMGHAASGVHSRYVHRSGSLRAAADLVSNWLAGAVANEEEGGAKVLQFATA